MSAKKAESKIIDILSKRGWLSGYHLYRAAVCIPPKNDEGLEHIAAVDSLVSQGKIKQCWGMIDQSIAMWDDETHRPHMGYKLTKKGEEDAKILRPVECRQDT